MKNLLFILLGSLLLVSGCSDQDEETNNETVVDIENTNNNEASQNTTVEVTLKVIKQYSEEFGDLEAYYINENIDETHSEADIDLTIQSVEYGKVLLNEQYRNNYENLADSDGKVTYVKVGMDISGEEAQLANHTFFAYQGEITLANGETAYADSTFSDLVSLSNELPTSGYVYFFVKADIPIEQLTFTAPAPFKNSDSLSISDPYEIDVELEHEE